MTENKNVLVEVKDIKKEFVTAKTFTGKPMKIVHAVGNVNLTIYEGETIGVVGESGCGKSTLGRSILRLIDPTSGQILYRGEDITSYNKEQMRQMRKKMQLIFQDPYASLNPRMTVLELIKAPLDAFNIAVSYTHLPRSERGQIRVRPYCSYVSGKDCGDRREKGALRSSAASLHKGAAVRNPHSRCGQSDETGDPYGRRAKPLKSAGRLLFPYPVQICYGALLQGVSQAS